MRSPDKESPQAEGPVNPLSPCSAEVAQAFAGHVSPQDTHRATALERLLHREGRAPRRMDRGRTEPRESHSGVPAPRRRNRGALNLMLSFGCMQEESPESAPMKRSRS